MSRYVFAITGASGVLLGLKIIKEISKTHEIHLIVSNDAVGIIKDEASLDISGMTQSGLRDFFKTDRLYYYGNDNFYSPIASGSFITDGMFVVPCSMKTLSGIANGYGNTLIERAADVTIKEKRRLLLAPREMPFSAIHLENMLKLARLGVIIAPPVPAFYHKPKSTDDILDFLCGKILDVFGIDNNLYKRWGAQS
ncbi:MAG: UbiX family flavin prenyltransferase [Thermodesulfovibrionales bacterium]|nr:UbiX family flavin prenyltransferase [Thermodesulfovibrionales bacterium]